MSEYMGRLKELEAKVEDPEERYNSILSSISIRENDIEQTELFGNWIRFRFSQFWRFRIIQGEAQAPQSSSKKESFPPTVGIIWFDPDFKSSVNQELFDQFEARLLRRDFYGLTASSNTIMR